MANQQKPALLEFPQFRELGDVVDVSRFVSDPRLSDNCAQALGFQVGHKIALILAEMKPGDVVQVGKIIGLDLSPPLLQKGLYNQIALFSGSFRREVANMILHTLINEAQVSVSFIDTRQKNRPHPNAQWGLHLIDHASGHKDNHALGLQIEKLEGLGWLDLLRRYPLVALEQLLPRR